MNQLESGNTYSLQELFSGNRKIIIPDMQRDYTWGDDDKKETLVKNFCQNLLDLSSSEKSIAIGMIYAYPNPENHYHLIDGQQRITTLFLLMGMLHKHTELKELKERLISTFELEEDDQEPYLQYAIRESSLYFLSDLVVKFFLDGNSKKEVSSIRLEPWYFSEYDHDPSIKSMLGALDVIEKIIKNKDDLKGFSTWLIEKVTFFYFDMQHREHGEEMFVVINTTGEPLEVTEELKPLLIGDIPCEQKREELSAQWEERETFFWKNKKSSEHTADEGVKDFLIWYIAIQTKKEFPVKPADGASDKVKADYNEKIKEYLNYFNSVKLEKKIISKLEVINSLFSTFSLITTYNNEEIIKQFAFCKKTENLSVKNIRDFPKDVIENIFLPYLYFKWKFSESNLHIKFLRRLRKNHFNQKWQRGGYFDWRYILQIIEKGESPNEVLIFEKQLDKIEKHEIPKSTWYTKEERIKDNLRNKNPENDTTLKEWEDHPDFMGDLSILLQAYLLEEKDNSIPELDVDKEYDIAKKSRIMENYKAVIEPLRTGEVKDNALFNIFRLFRVFSGINKIKCFYRCNNLQGVTFSQHNRNHLSREPICSFLQLLRSGDIFKFCHDFVKTAIKNEQIFDLNDENFSSSKLVKAWLALKVFRANKANIKLELYDGNDTGVSAYDKCNQNKIFTNLPFSLENAICGFAVKSGGGSSYVHYTNSHENYWCQPNIIDTPFADVPFVESLRVTEKNDSKPREGNYEQLKENKKAIDEIIKFIFQ